MIKCNHISKETDTIKHKSGSRVKLIEDIYSLINLDEINKSENKNEAVDANPPGLDPIGLYNLFHKSYYIYNDDDINENMVYKIFMAIDPSGGGSCEYAFSIGYVTYNAKLVICWADSKFLEGTNTLGPFLAGNIINFKKRFKNLSKKKIYIAVESNSSFAGDEVATSLVSYLSEETGSTIELVSILKSTNKKKRQDDTVVENKIGYFKSAKLTTIFIFVFDTCLGNSLYISKNFSTFDESKTMDIKKKLYEQLSNIFIPKKNENKKIFTGIQGKLNNINDDLGITTLSLVYMLKKHIQSYFNLIVE